MMSVFKVNIVLFYTSNKPPWYKIFHEVHNNAANQEIMVLWNVKLTVFYKSLIVDHIASQFDPIHVLSYITANGSSYTQPPSPLEMLPTHVLAHF
jgi:hypothetical protein